MQRKPLRLGFTSWLQSLRGSPRESAASPAPSARGDNESFSRHTREDSASRQTPTPTQARHDTETEAKKDRRRSRGFSLSRTKSQHGNKNRRSWFGGTPDVDEDIPMVPRLVSRGDQHQQQDAGRREVDVTALPMPSNSKSPRPPMEGAYSRKEDGGSENHRGLRRRPSWFSSEGKGPIDAPPPLPAVPVSIATSSIPSTSTLPADKRRSRAASIKSVNSTRSRKKRSSFWASSNPDDSGSDVPPMPALVRGASTESSCNELSDASDHRRRTVRKSSHGADAKKPRPVSTASRNYGSRSPARGFLSSPDGACEGRRKSFRESLGVEYQAEMIWLADEQRAEWSRFRVPSHRLDDDLESAGDDRRPKFSNSQALAALEFGIR